MNLRRGLLPALFFCSGVSGLLYEVVWFRMLIRIFGITVYAVSTILVVYMGGLALGSFMGGRFLAARSNALRAYGAVEVLIGVSAMASTLMIGALPVVFQAALHALSDQPSAVVALRILLSGAALIIPTVLMGSTLPILSGVLAELRGATSSAVGNLYGLNTLGAVVGVIGSGFFFLALFGERATVLIGCVINVLVGASALLLARRFAVVSAPESKRDAATLPPPPERRVLLLLVIYAASGFCALAYQVVWSRILILLLGNSVYGFASMLSVYLFGIAAGSVIMAKLQHRVTNPLLVFAVLEISIAFLAMLSIHIYVGLGVLKTDPKFLYSVLWSFDDFLQLPLCSALIVLPVTLLLGAIFPVVTQLATDPKSSVPVSIGRIYGYNTVGSILGSFAAGFVLIPLAGTFGTVLIASLASFLLGASLYAMSPNRDKKHTAAIALGAGAFLLLAVRAPTDPFRTVLEARLENGTRIVKHEEDKAATITLLAYPDTRDSEAETLAINGLHVSGTGFAGRFMVHMPLLFHPAPKKSLLIGFGAGEAFCGSIDHGVDTTVVELVPAVFDSFAMFHRDHEAYAKSPNARVVFNDGRNFMLGSSERYDLVFVDGTPPIFASGMVNLYAFEFAKMVSEHLDPDGLFVIWIPLQLFDEDFWMIARNFTDVFSEVMVWSGPPLEGIFMMGTVSKSHPFRTPAEEIDRRIRARHLDARVAAGHIMSGIVLEDAVVRRFVAAYPRLTDDHPYTEFPLFRFWRGETLEGTSAFLRKAKG